MKDYRVTHVELLIIEGDIKSALKNLLQLFEQFESDLANDALIQLSQWNSYERDVNQGVIERGGTDVARMQRSTLSLKDEAHKLLIEKGLVQTQPPANEVAEVSPDKYTYIFEDYFTDNRNEWFEYLTSGKKNDDPASFYFEDNSYIIEILKDVGACGDVTTLCVFDQEQDFKIEATIDCLDLSEEASYGLVWGMDSATCDSYSFMIYPYGFVDISANSIDKSKRRIILDNIDFAPIQENIGTNTFTIEKVKQKMHFYINGKLVHIEPFMPFFGNSMGISCFNKLKIAVKSLKVGIA